MCEIVVLGWGRHVDTLHASTPLSTSATYVHAKAILSDKGIKKFFIPNQGIDAQRDI